MFWATIEYVWCLTRYWIRVAYDYGENLCIVLYTRPETDTVQALGIPRGGRRRARRPLFFMSAPNGPAKGGLRAGLSVRFNCVLIKMITVEQRDMLMRSKEIDASQAERLGRSCLSIVPRFRSHARLRRNATMSHAFWGAPISGVARGRRRGRPASGATHLGVTSKFTRS
ncbi:hypothetical protein EVAR_12996_1 [Eumeta japonica]|uniref:Uncharacterized protein n=1 Tax=Eumeta variegata TaxID=151549 RepID=A0A4C1TWV5_EUMVA|nr:hypothetical protein EVAR_12996_1 [Eumeta japonica]